MLIFSSDAGMRRIAAVARSPRAARLSGARGPGGFLAGEADAIVGELPVAAARRLARSPEGPLLVAGSRQRQPLGTPDDHATLRGPAAIGGSLAQAPPRSVLAHRQRKAESI
jgi:hypothetical protein